MVNRAYLRGVRLLRDEVPSYDVYPFSIPAVRGLDELELDPKITFLIGENGAGKSTLIEAIAVLAGFNAEGGSRNFRFANRSSESPLHRYMRPIRGRRPRDGYFLRAESYFNVATEIERLDEGGGGPPLIDGYGGRSLHEQSHGESFLALATHRFHGHGLYILDEPEAALSPQRQLALLTLLYDLIERRGSQFVIATHSPLLMAYPGARILHLDRTGLAPIAYRDTEHYQITRGFLEAPERYFAALFDRRERG
ncbi:MAG: AAA family ATPase [Kofleriaceae bacterium]|nr:AAA family ATPase [Kofleriaceae bacterium]MBP6838961.1 AAA family ATPase [Kofleriaceae bacterium]MBP9202453.1 AAA family ATPase [Kofleriaceae bacterium]